MLARRLTTISPAMRLADALETMRIHRVAGRTGARTVMVTMQPCRAPHHTISRVGLIGAARGRGQARCHWHTMACSAWMNCRSAAATSWRSCTSPSRRVSQEYNFAGVLNLNLLKTSAVRLLSFRESGRLQ
jgi:hypothetical protein